MMSIPRVGLIGLGAWGKNLARNFHNLDALRLVCDHHPEARKRMQDQYPDVLALEDSKMIWDTVANEIDAIAISSSAETHARIIRNALNAGKDVYVEKPLVLDLADAQELTALAQKKNAILMVGHLLQYHPVYCRLVEIIRDGVLGEVQFIDSRRSGLGAIRTVEDALWCLAPHDCSMILGLLEKQIPSQLPGQVSCVGSSFITDGIYDNSTVQLQFEGGLRGQISVSWISSIKEARLMVVGSKGTAVFDDTLPWEQKLQVWHQQVRYEDGRPIANPSASECIVVPQGEPLRAECEHFLEAISSRQEPRTGIAEAMRVQRVLCTADASMRANGQLLPLQ